MSSVLEHAAPIARRDQGRDRRELARRPVYLGDGLTLNVVWTERSVAAEVIDLTPEGLGIVLRDGSALPSVGTVVALEHTGPVTEGIRQHAEVRSVGVMKMRGLLFARIGVAFVAERRNAGGGIQQRVHPRYACSDRFPVSAAARCALFFREWLYFRVSELCAGGMTLRTSLSNKALLPGLVLEFTVRLPLQPGYIVKGRLTSIRRERGATEFTVGVAFNEPAKGLLRSIGEYVLFVNKHETPRALRNAGLEVGSVERVVTFGYATTPDERAATRELRVRAHRAAGNFTHVAPEDLSCSSDDHSRHLVGRFGPRIVAYLRLNFVERDAQRSRYAVEGGHQIPPHMLQAGIVEGGAAGVDPDFRGTGLQLAIVQRGAMVAKAAGCGYFLAAVGDPALELYRDWGFDVLESRVVEPKPGWRFRSHLLCINVDALTRVAEDASGGTEAVLRFVQLETPRMHDE